MNCVDLMCDIYYSAAHICVKAESGRKRLLLLGPITMELRLQDVM